MGNPISNEAKENENISPNSSGENVQENVTEFILKTSYIQHGTNLEPIRNILSFVAALLATITFAAAFSLPGGTHSNNGKALLAKRPYFLVFLLSDVYAMCTSMLVLFCLIWSMVTKPNKSLLLVDGSVFLLMQSLYSTLLAFMTGIFTVISHGSLWAAILIFVMCSIVGILANRTIMNYVLDKWIHVAKTVKIDPLRISQEVSNCSHALSFFLIVEVLVQFMGPIFSQYRLVYSIDSSQGTGFMYLFFLIGISISLFRKMFDDARQKRVPCRTIAKNVDPVLPKPKSNSKLTRIR